MRRRGHRGRLGRGPGQTRRADPHRDPCHRADVRPTGPPHRRAAGVRDDGSPRDPGSSRSDAGDRWLRPERRFGEAARPVDGYGSAAHGAVTGDALALSGAHGAQTAHNAKPFLLGISVPGEVDDEGAARWRVVSPHPHSIFVNGAGHRFADEAHYVSVSHAMQVVDGRTQERPNLPVFLVCDSRYRAAHDLAGFLASDPLPPQVVEARDLDELGTAWASTARTSRRRSRSSTRVSARVLTPGSTVGSHPTTDARSRRTGYPRTPSGRSPSHRSSAPASTRSGWAPPTRVA